MAICATPSDALPTEPAAMRVSLNVAALFRSVNDLMDDAGFEKSDIAIGRADRSLRTPAKMRLLSVAPPIVTPPMLPVVRISEPLSAPPIVSFETLAALMPAWKSPRVVIEPTDAAVMR